DDAGKLWCWGFNGEGELGNGSFMDEHVPVPVASTDQWTAIAVGRHHACGIKADGTMWCWGDNSTNQLGNNLGGQSTTPIVVGSETFTHVAAGFNHTCGRTTTGHLRCWGYDNLGELGRPNTTTIYGAVLFDGVDQSGWTDVIAKYENTCARRDDGSLWCWG